MRNAAIQFCQANGINPAAEIKLQRTENVIPLAAAFPTWLYYGNQIQMAHFGQVEDNDFSI